jgi:DnaK suppressor protein
MVMRSKTVVEPVSEDEIKVLRGTLDEKRLELLDLYKHDVQMGQESSDDSADDSLDRANNSFNRELMFLLSDTEREMLIQVEDAMQRVDSGAYGACIYCEGSIGRARLNAVPWARHCIDCQELEERGELDA